jgi:acetyltransferase-like isoleucine patch superfamily enzyme
MPNLKAALRMLARSSGLDDKTRFGEEWGASSTMVAMSHLAFAFLRGTWRRMLFGEAKGVVLVGKGVRIKNGRKLRVGNGFIAEDGCEINALSRQGIILGNRVTVGKYALVRPTSDYGGELGEGLKVGDGSNIGPYCYIGCSGYIEIGRNVLMSPRVSVYSENHNFNLTDLPMKSQGVTRGKVKIEDDCWIASHSVILADVTIGTGSVVAAGSVVTKDVPPFSIVAGVPARVLRSRLSQANTKHEAD